MSRSSSTGDLVPKDITEILALQASKKKRGSSLGRAFSWFKSSKRKRSVSNGQSRSGGQCGRSGESATAKQMHASSEASKGKQKLFSCFNTYKCRVFITCWNAYYQVCFWGFGLVDENQRCVMLIPWIKRIHNTMPFDFSQALWCQSVQTLNVEFFFLFLNIFFCTIWMVIAGTSLIQAGLGYNNKDKSSLEWLICLLLFLLPSFFTFLGSTFPL